MSRKIRIVDVGPRDGLQNEKTVLDQATRLEFAERLAQAGMKSIELGAFVSPQWVPQMAGSAELLTEALKRTAKGKSLAGVDISALVPNQRGMSDALAVGLKHVAIFASASESFAKKNINCTIEESFVRFEEVMKMAKKNKVRVRGYLSMCFGCPFEGKIDEKQVVRLAKRLVELGVYEVSIGDTIGVAHPAQVKRLVGKLVKAVGAKKLAMHFHDTRGTALANILASIDLGIRVFDSSLGGLGGCPYAPAATGNVSTEDVVYMVHGMGFDTGLDLQKLIDINKWMTGKIGHELPSRVGKAGIPKPRPL
ncbi:MAG TPA: hydroxymethylglutaryl-CoA lyase [Bdellovibrionales bacterium]|nr:hydroxymethylglutaryl-CoA lyase [Bdellovibrionales bacterium]